jgi:hypothetical protein
VTIRARLRHAQPGLLISPSPPNRGYSLLELVFVLAISVTAGATAVPQLLAGLDDQRASGATHYMSARFQRARMEAVMRSTSVAIRFTQTGGGYAYAVYMDGNGNGVRTNEILNGTDRLVTAMERLSDHFGDVDFGVAPGLPPVDPGGTAPGTDPIHLGASRLAVFSALGSSSSGTVYIRSRKNAQYAIRVFGETGKTRMVKFNPRTGQWRPL